MKRNVSIGLVLLMLMLLCCAPAIGASGGGAYTVTVRYYDSIQVTYTGTDFTGGAWESRGDVPIGGTEIADQIYCADPFISFHKLADSTGWDNGAGATVDVKGGYAVAAPWNTSIALQQYGDAVHWLVLNGYRGDFLADDEISQESVRRLQGLYGYVGEIDKTIALMATKIAIWKAVTNDNVYVESTSLDNAPDRRDALDSLIQGLLDDALAGRETGLWSTGFSIAITGSADLQFSDSGSNPRFGYYGPLRVEASLENADLAKGYSLRVDKLYLAVQGMELDHIEMTDRVGRPLDQDNIFGTDNTAWYLDAGALNSDGLWVSDAFYLKVPINRHHTIGAPLSSDLLSIRAMAVARDVPLIQGTPVTFVYDSAGMQVWDAVQAFIGGANEGACADLYATARMDTGESAYGNLYIAKQVFRSVVEADADADAVYTFKVYATAEPVFDDAIMANLADYLVLPAKNSNEDHTITMKNGDMVEIDGLPSNLYYWVEEVDVPEGFTTAYTVLTAAEPAEKVEGALAGPIMMDRSGAYGVAMVEFANTGPTTEAPETQEDTEKPEESEKTEESEKPEESEKTDESEEPEGSEETETTEGTDETGESEAFDEQETPAEQGGSRTRPSGSIDEDDDDTVGRTVTQSKEEAPKPMNPGAILVPKGEASYEEVHEDGTPLGEWTWDAFVEEWLFDDSTPLGNLAPTGDYITAADWYLPLILVLASMCLFTYSARAEHPLLTSHLNCIK